MQDFRPLSFSPKLGPGCKPRQRLGHNSSFSPLWHRFAAFRRMLLFRTRLSMVFLSLTLCRSQTDLFTHVLHSHYSAPPNTEFAMGDVVNAQNVQHHVSWSTL